MSAKAERQRNRRIKLVGGGYRWTREAAPDTGGSMKAKRRAARKAAKAHRKGNRKPRSAS